MGGTESEVMRAVQRHHHFKAQDIEAGDRVARLEASIVSLLLRSDVSDADRDSSIAWELKHSSAVTQFGRLIAAKRGQDVELGAVGALLHDVYTIATGSYEDHARRGGALAEDMMRDVGGFSAEDIDIVKRVVMDHSDKHLISSNKWSEFGKDVDILDCFLYPHALDEYLMTKPLPKVKHYLRRAQLVWAELGVPLQPGFHQLDRFEDGRWLDVCKVLGEEQGSSLWATASADLSFPPFALSRTLDGSLLASFASADADRILAAVRAGEGASADRIVLPEANEALLLWPGIRRFETMEIDRLASKCIVIDASEGL